MFKGIGGIFLLKDPFSFELNTRATDSMQPLWLYIYNKRAKKEISFARCMKNGDSVLNKIW